MQPSELCRICGGTGLFLQIFDPESRYYDDIESCLSVKVKRNDALSQVICHKCVGTLAWCKDFVGKVNHVKKGRYEPSPKLCYSCRTADGPLFPLPKPSGEKLQDFFGLSTQKPKNLKVCHQCQFSLDCVSDLREKANTAQQLSRRGQHLQFQVLRKSPSVEEILCSLKSREIEVDLSTNSARSLKGRKSSSSTIGSEGSTLLKQQNGVSNNKSVNDSKPTRKNGAKNSKDLESEVSVNLWKVQDSKHALNSDDKPNNKGSRSKISRESGKSAGREGYSRNVTTEDQVSSSKNDSTESCTSSRRGDKRRRTEEKSSNSTGGDSNLANFAVSVTCRRLSREENSSSKSSDSSPRRSDGPGGKKPRNSKITPSKPSTKNKSQKKDDGKTDDCEIVLMLDTPKTLRSRAKSGKSLGKSTEDNIPDLKRPVVKAADSNNSPQSSSKRMVKKMAGSPKKRRSPQVTVGKAVKRKPSEIYSPAGSGKKGKKQELELGSSPEMELLSGKKGKKQEFELCSSPEMEPLIRKKIKKHELELCSSPEKEPLSGKRATKDVNNVISDVPYTCAVCCKDFSSTAIGKDHELQHDKRYNNFALKLFRVDLSETTKDVTDKEDAQCDDYWLLKSTKPKETCVADFDLLFKNDVNNVCLNPEGGKGDEKEAESILSQPKNTGTEESRPLFSDMPEPESRTGSDGKREDVDENEEQIRDEDNDNDNNREKDTEEHQRTDEDREKDGEPDVSTESQSKHNGHRDPETQVSSSKAEDGPEKELELKDSKKQDSDQEKEKSSNIESEEKLEDSKEEESEEEQSDNRKSKEIEESSEVKNSEEMNDSKKQDSKHEKDEQSDTRESEEIRKEEVQDSEKKVSQEEEEESSAVGESEETRKEEVQDSEKNVSQEEEESSVVGESEEARKEEVQESEKNVSEEEEEESSVVGESEETRKEEVQESEKNVSQEEKDESSPVDESAEMGKEDPSKKSSLEPELASVLSNAETETPIVEELKKPVQKLVPSTNTEEEVADLVDDSAPRSPILGKKTVLPGAETVNAVINTDLTEDDGDAKSDKSDKTEKEIPDSAISTEVRNGDLGSS